MKLRIKGSSLRLRLTQAEVHQLESGGPVEEQVQFAPGTALTYRLIRGIFGPEISASYSENVIEIRIPDQQALKWCRTQQVTLEHGQQLGEGDGDLRIVVEKDFACLAPRTDEDESDNFPHPKAGDPQSVC
jgi:hypothetical protein